MTSDRLISASLYFINALVWFAVFAVCKSIIETTDLRQMPYKDLASFLIPSLCVAIVRTSNKRQNSLDVIILFLLIQSYASIGHRRFEESLGFALILGIIGTSAYYFIDSRLSQNPLRPTHTGLGKIVIGSILASAVGIPLAVGQGRDVQLTSEVRPGTGHALGEIEMICRFSDHLRRTHCQTLKLIPDLDNVCKLGVASLAPEAIRSEALAALTSPKLAEKAAKYIADAEEAIQSARTQRGLTDAAICAAYEQNLNDSYARAQTILK